MYLNDMVTEWGDTHRRRYSVYQYTTQKLQQSWFVQTKARIQRLHSCFPHGWQDAKYLGYLPLPSQVHYLEAKLEVLQLQFAIAPCYGMQASQVQLNLLCHNASHTSFFCLFLSDLIISKVLLSRLESLPSTQGTLFLKLSISFFISLIEVFSFKIFVWFLLRISIWNFSFISSIFSYFCKLSMCILYLS